MTYSDSKGRPINLDRVPQDRRTAYIEGARYFIGDPCSTGGHTLRYATNGACVVCLRETMSARQKNRTRKPKSERQPKTLGVAAESRIAMMNATQLMPVELHNDRRVLFARAAAALYDVMATA